jgi:predicted amidohydrolase YtcJ
MILDEDPYSIPVDRIKDVKIIRTVVGGTTVYEG